MAHLRMLTPETSPEPETRPSGLWQPKPTDNGSTSTNTTATHHQQQHQHQQQPPLQKRKRSWPFTTTRPVSPPSSTSPMRDDDDVPASRSSRSSDVTTSIKALWLDDAGGFRTAARRGLAPFQDAHYSDDIQPIFAALVDSGVDDVTSPEYALAFYPRAHELALHAENALLHHGDRALAAGLYLRACAVLRAGRYSPFPPSSSSGPVSSSSEGAPAAAEEGGPSPPCPVRARAWHLQKSYHARAGRLHPSSPLDEVVIPHTHDAATAPDPATTAAGAGVRDRGSIAAAAAATKSKAGAGPAARPQIPLAVRLPPRTLRAGNPCPAVLVVSGDRTAHSRLCEDLLARGWGCVVVEAPGWGDCPVPAGPAATSSGAETLAEASALWASVLDWMGAIRVFDMARVVVWAAAAAAPAGGASRVPVDGLVGQFAAAVGGSRVRGCVAVVAGGEESAPVTMAGGAGRVLVVADNSSGVGVGAAGAGYADDDGLVLLEYGALRAGAGQEAVRSLAAGAAAVYDWVEDLLGLDLVV